MATSIVRAYASHLERRLRLRTERAVARFLVAAPPGDLPDARAEEAAKAERTI
jgi:hypothetical protein